MRLLHAARLSQLARDHQQTGIESSDREAQRWADGAGHVIVATVADTKTGTSAMWARPNLRPWITEPARLAEYDGIVAYKSDRLSRAAWADEIQIRLWAQEHGKQLFIVSPSLHWPPANQAEQLSWEIFASQAHEEWKNTSERYKRMQSWLRSEGKFVGRPPVFYESVPAPGGHKMLVPTDEGRRWVPEIFARVIAGESLNDIARWLDGHGVRPVSGKHWWARSVGTVVRNPVYAGRRCEQDPRTKRYGKMIHKCEPLVDSATFRRAGEALDGRPKRGPADAQNRALLAGTLACPRCGDSPMYRIKSGNRGTETYSYRCSGRGSQRKGCGVMVNLAAADTLVDRFVSCLESPVLTTVTIPGHGWAAELEDVRLAVRELAALDLPDGEYDARLAGLRAERDRLAALPTVPDRVEQVSTGQSYAQMWASLDGPERGAWLRSAGIRCYAARTDSGLAEAAYDRLLLANLGAASLLAGDGVSVIVTWLGSGVDWADAEE